MAEPAKKRATYADLEAVPPHLVAEIIDGELMTYPRPSPRHGATANALGAELTAPFQKGRNGPGGWVFIVEPEIKFGGDILVPDIAGWRRERLTTYPERNYVEIAPDWLCEVLSGSTEKRDRTLKMRIYGDGGIPHLWLIDPRLQILEAFELAERHWVKIGDWNSDDEVRAPPFDAVAFSLADLWPLDPPARIQRRPASPLRRRPLTMPINITMPALSPTMEEGNLSKWLVKEGDKVSPGDVIAEIETDKATMEVEAVDEGTVAKLVVPAGTEGVKVNALIAVLTGEGEDASAAAKGGDAPAKAEAPKVAAAPATAEPAKAAPAKAGEAKPAAKAEAQAAAPAANGHAEGDRTFASPLARRIARDAGVDVAAITGSGPHGRVVKADVEAAVAGGAKATAAKPAATVETAAPAPKAAPAAAPAVKPMSDGRGAQTVRAGFLRPRAA